MGSKTFYTVVVVAVDVFESSIVDERHFGNKTEAETYSKNLPDGLNGLVCELRM